jgi:hypothetical protein
VRSAESIVIDAHCAPRGPDSIAAALNSPHDS